MSWYPAVALEPTTLLLQGIPAAWWVTQYIQLHTGLIVPVAFLRDSPDGAGTLIELRESHQLPFKAATFFTLSDGTFDSTTPPPAAQVSRLADDDGDDAPYGCDEDEDASNQYPPRPAVVVGAAATTPVAAMQVLSESGSDAGDDSVSDRPRPLSLLGRILLFGFVFLVITFGAMAMSMGVAYSMGSSKSSWLLVLIWSLGAVPVIAVILAYFLRFLLVRANSEKFSRCHIIIWVLMFFVFFNAMGIPFAWATANVKATERYMDSANELVVNAFNESQTVTSFVAERYHYVQLEEQEWSLDWRLSQQRAVTYTEYASEDDEFGTSYTYCAVPIVYNGGVVPPTLTTRLWALCAKVGAGACTKEDGATCGWNWPLNLVSLRVMNQNEMFYRAVDVDDDYYWWSKVMELVPPAAGGNVPVLFSDGPDAMQVNRDAAQATFDLILHLTLGLWLVWSFLCAAVSVRLLPSI